ncbi:hypothetical protein [Streptomyces cavernae]|uniref:hypothetical protein n=1 Tax=Streptomyces cavernae TaxID=2259034 RepID=UPI000FEBD186|nr:hypothetical protein [Streptomyces cavernae]
MLALRLARGARPVVKLRRLLVAAASAGTGFLLLCALGYALGHPQYPGAAALRLTWCLPPLATTVYFAVAVARTDPTTRPRTGLSAIGLGPSRLAVLSIAAACAAGSVVALVLFLYLRGDLPGLPFGGAAAGPLAADRRLPVPAALTLLALVPATASAATALSLHPRTARAAGRPRSGIGTGTGTGTTTGTSAGAGAGAGPTTGARTVSGAVGAPRARGAVAADAGAPATEFYDASVPGAPDAPETAEAPETQPAPPALQAPEAPSPPPGLPALVPFGPDDPYDAHEPRPPLPAPSGLPWGMALLAAGLAAETYAWRERPGAVSGLELPGGFAGSPGGVLIGWALTAVGLAIAGPALAHVCGRLLQAVRPGALRLLAGRVLQEEARRIGRPLGVVCAVASGAYAGAAVLHSGPRPGPLSALGAVLVIGCPVATLLTAAVEARQARAHTTAALLRLGAKPSMLRRAAALRAVFLLAVCAPLTWAVAELAAVPLRG